MDFLYQVLPLVGVIFMFFPLYHLGRKAYLAYSRKEAERIEAETIAEAEAERLAIESAPRCICGEYATEPVPQLKRSRGATDFFREWFAMPPKYKRVVNKHAERALCKSHAHVADAFLDQFIHNIRAAFCKTYSDIAVQAAGFEQEKLMVQLSESLTDAQKRNSRKSAATLRVLPKTGTDGDGEQQ